MLYTILSAICIMVLVLLSVSFILECCFRRKRAVLINFLRKFKKGKCAYIYIAALPIYFIGLTYAKIPWLQALFISINKAVSLVAMRFDFSDIDLLMKDNPVYAIAVYLCFLLAAINAAIFVVSLGHQRIWIYRNRKKWQQRNCDKYLIIGNNAECQSIYDSGKGRSDKKHLSVAIAGEFSDEDRKKMYVDGTAFLGYVTQKSSIIEKITKRFSSNSVSPVPTKNKDVAETELINLLRMAIRNTDGRYVAIINTQDDEKNIALCRKAAELISKHLSSLNTDESAVAEKNQKAFREKKKDQIISLFSRLEIYVFGDARYDAIYANIVESSNGCIHYINKYRQIAIDFIDKYPLTGFMSADQIDYDTSYIKDDININVAFIGFGKTGQQIFLTSVANNQFICKENGEEALKTVKYHIFDKVHAENDKNLNHNYYRYRNEFFSDDSIEKLKLGEKIGFPYAQKHLKEEIRKEKYLPLPQFPAEEYYHNIDINDPDFYNQLRKMSTHSPNDVTCIIVTFGSDLENLDMAQKLIEKKQEWDIKNLFVFVKRESDDNSDPIFERPERDCLLIGNTMKTVFDLDKIVDNDLLKMALRRHKVYSLEYDITHGYASASDKESIEKSYKNAVYNWFIERTQAERNSNLYGTLSLRSKLNLMGMDIVRKDEEGKAMSYDEYLKVYAYNDIPTPRTDIDADGKKIWYYSLNFSASRRKSMAVHEHYRWNSYMISQGIVPSTISDISEEQILKNGKTVYTNGKNYPLRRHGNLTTFEGLEDFRRIVSLRNGVSEAEEDVIKYDYQLLDDAPWFLDVFGYKIINKLK